MTYTGYEGYTFNMILFALDGNLTAAQAKALFTEVRNRGAKDLRGQRHYRRMMARRAR